MEKRARNVYQNLFLELISKFDRTSDPEIVKTLWSSVGPALERPWLEQRKPRAGKFSTFWDWELDKKARARSKLYRVASRSDSEEAWKAYHEFDRSLRTVIKRKQSEQFESFLEDMASFSTM